MVYNSYNIFLNGRQQNDLNVRDAQTINHFIDWAWSPDRQHVGIASTVPSSMTSLIDHLAGLAFAKVDSTVEFIPTTTELGTMSDDSDHVSMLDNGECNLYLKGVDSMNDDSRKMEFCSNSVEQQEKKMQ
jgi:hypothetical protein